MVDKNDTLLREVEEELRREQLNKIWDKYGTYVLGAAAAVVLSVGGYQVWHGRKVAAAEAAGASYEAATALFDKGKSDEAVTALTGIAAAGSPGYAALAELSLAGAKLRDDKPKEALEIFERLASSPAADPLLKGFAALQAASVRIGEADFTEIQNRLTPLTVDDSAWRFQARELLGAAALKAGKLTEARAALEPILGARGVPQGVLERTNVLMGRIAAEEVGAAAVPGAPSTTVPADAAAAGATAAKPAETPASSAADDQKQDKK